MNNEVTTMNSEILSSLVMNGDLSRLTPLQKVNYYRQYCERLGLDPLSQPFKIMKLQGKETMYCDRGGTQQLSRINKVSHAVVARESSNGCYVVTAQASTPDGRKTESIGAVPIDKLTGEALCNAMMKAETKAKRRATLDLLGVGLLDESEISSIPNAVTEDIPHVEEKTLPVLNESNQYWNSVITELKNGTKTMEQMKQHFTISEEIESTLTNIVNQPA
jgi:hypothetical protein